MRKWESVVIPYQEVLEQIIKNVFGYYFSMVTIIRLWSLDFRPLIIN